MEGVVYLETCDGHVFDVTIQNWAVIVKMGNFLVICK